MWTIELLAIPILSAGFCVWLASRLHGPRTQGLAAAAVVVGSAVVVYVLNRSAVEPSATGVLLSAVGSLSFVVIPTTIALIAARWLADSGLGARRTAITALLVGALSVPVANVGMSQALARGGGAMITLVDECGPVGSVRAANAWWAAGYSFRVDGSSHLPVGFGTPCHCQGDLDDDCGTQRLRSIRP